MSTKGPPTREGDEEAAGNGRELTQLLTVTWYLENFLRIMERHHVSTKGPPTREGDEEAAGNGRELTQLLTVTWYLENFLRMTKRRHVSTKGPSIQLKKGPFIDERGRRGSSRKRMRLNTILNCD